MKKRILSVMFACMLVVILLIGLTACKKSKSEKNSALLDDFFDYDILQTGALITDGVKLGADYDGFSATRIMGERDILKWTKGTNVKFTFASDGSVIKSYEVKEETDVNMFEVIKTRKLFFVLKSITYIGANKITTLEFLDWNGKVLKEVQGYNDWDFPANKPDVRLQELEDGEWVDYIVFEYENEVKFLNYEEFAKGDYVLERIDKKKAPYQVGEYRYSNCSSIFSDEPVVVYKNDRKYYETPWVANASEQQYFLMPNGNLFGQIIYELKAEDAREETYYEGNRRYLIEHIMIDINTKTVKPFKLDRMVKVTLITNYTDQMLSGFNNGFNFIKETSEYSFIFYIDIELKTLTKPNFALVDGNLKEIAVITKDLSTFDDSVLMDKDKLYVLDSDANTTYVFNKNLEVIKVLEDIDFGSVNGSYLLKPHKFGDNFDVYSTSDFSRKYKNVERINNSSFGLQHVKGDAIRKEDGKELLLFSHGKEVEISRKDTKVSEVLEKGTLIEVRYTDTSEKLICDINGNILVDYVDCTAAYYTTSDRIKGRLVTYFRVKTVTDGVEKIQWYSSSTVLVHNEFDN